MKALEVNAPKWRFRVAVELTRAPAAAGRYRQRATLWQVAIRTAGVFLGLVYLLEWASGRL